MKKIQLILLFSLLFIAGSLSAQNMITGKVKNSVTKEPVAVVSIVMKNSPDGDFTNGQGNFKFSTGSSFPVTLVFSSIGYETKELIVNNAKELIAVELTPVFALGQDVVVYSNRSVMKKLESPVTIERIGSKDIINSSQINYYDMLQGLKGVDVTVSSIGFTTVTTRGFNTSGNTNFSQIVDGMDNQAPGLNFPLGNAIGLTQLDVDNIELLSGASSALYGSRGLNGTMVMTGKNPFKYQGLSVLINQGVNHVKSNNFKDPVSPSPYYDWTIRYAKKINDKLAFKVNLQYTKANDWVATDSSNKNGPGSRYTDPNYNGANYYGGATSVDINPFLQFALANEPALAPIVDPLLTQSNYVARTGYGEYGFLDNNATLLKINAELRYKIKPNLEAIFSGSYGTGNVVYTNDTRYQLKDFKVGQYRAELKADKWFLRAYTTQENSGKTLIAGPTAQYTNESWKPSFDPATFDGWYPQYTVALLQSLAGGSDYANASLAARDYADLGRAMPGTAYFNHLKDSISQRPITDGGTLFLDRSKLYNAEFQYNFSSLVKFAEIIAGANWRLYDLNSKGTLFPDYDGPIKVHEYSAYAQISKKLADNKLRLAASFRFDKNTLFKDPKTTTRLSAVYEVAKENFIRFSYQNAYSFPSNIQSLQNTLNGYNSYASGGSLLLLNDQYHFDKYPPYSLKSVQTYQQTGNPNDLEKYFVNDIKPQSVNAFELGYAALIGKRVLLDVLGYYSTWQNFIGYTNVANTPGTDDVTAFKDHSTYIEYGIAINGAQTVNTYGYAASINVDLSHHFIAKANYYSDYLKNRNNGQINNFNTPSYHINLEFGNTGFGKKQNLSFNTSLRYRPSYFYEVTGGLAKGTVPASTVIDAQLGYKFTQIHSAVKIGGTNITNRYYSTGIANPMIGGVYYVSFAYNVF